MDPVAATALELTGDLVLAIGPDGLVVRAGPSIARVLGVAPADALGERFWRVCGPGQASAARCGAAARGELPLAELPAADTLLAADGTPRWVTWSWGRTPDGLLDAVGRDVTAERRAADARRRSEERFELAARASRDLIYDYDVPTDRIAWGQNSHEVFGVAHEELGRTIPAWEARIHPEDLPRVQAKLQVAIDAGTTYEDEYRFRRGDGSWAITRDRGLVITGPDGRAVRMIGSMEDVTEQRRAHAELAASEARYRFIAETTSDLVYDYDPAADTFRYISPRVVDWLGYPAERFRAEPGLWWRLMDPGDRERVERAFAADAADRRARIRYEYRLRTAGGALRPVHDVGAVEYDEAGQVVRVQGTVSDIGELRALQDELARAQRFESVGRLAGGVAHDFNNLLTGMLANVALARLGAGDAARATEHLAEVERAIERAARLVRDLLAYSRRAPLALGPVDLRECIGAVVRLLRPTLGPKVQVVVDDAPDAPPAWADAARIEQVLVNLALNARDAMPDGGRLRFGLDAATSGRDGGREFLRVAVEDTGVGMSPDVRARAFEPFFTTKAERGSGLGLSVVHGIVAQHDGWVECESAPGQGSRFAFYLPRATTPAGDAPARHAGATPPPREGEVVLVADDEPAIRRAVRAMLEGFGFEVLTARDGQEAIEAFTRARDRVRAVVLDLTMPRLSGREAYEAIARLDPQVPVVLCTGFSVDSVEDLPGVAAALAKPYHAADLAKLLRRLIDARAAARPVSGA
jgi:PAS domain S-box-containing protein